MWPLSGVYGIAVVLVMVAAFIAARRSMLSGKRLALAMVAVTSLVYVTWRIVDTIPQGNPWATAAGITLLAAELVGLIQVVAQIATGWQGARPPRSRAIPLTSTGAVPSVDIFIATYDEPISVLEPTLAGALGIRYPGEITVYLCDDGSRESMRALAERYGAVHLTREDHAHAKAGNLNNALTLSHGELIVTLDADMIPRANFLEQTVGLFDDATLAFVQAPQAFHNEDPFQYNLFSGRTLPNEQDYFMRSLQEGKAAYNAVMYVGSNTVFRRTALTHIGGFATGVITEDMATGMLLQAAGFRGDFVPEIIAAGLAPESFATLLTQRTRWSRGNIQTARKWNPLTLPGLSFMQRWIYTDGIVYWHFGILRLIFILAPLVYLLGGVTVVDATLPSVAVIWLPYFVTSIAAMRLISGGRRSSLWTSIYETAMAPTVALAVLAEWVGLSNKAFAVTPKGISNENLNFRAGIAAPHLVMLALSVAGLLNAWWWSAERYTVESLLVTTCWTLFNIAGLVMAVLVCLERPRYRSTERTDVSIVATASLWHGDALTAQVLDLSSAGARLFVPWAANGGHGFALRASRQHKTVSMLDVGEVPGATRWVSEGAEGLSVGFEFTNLSAAHMIGIMRHITEAPGWVRGDREVDASLLSSATRTLVGAATRVRPSLRAEARVSTRDVGNVTVGNTTTSAHLEDLSFGGCRIRTNANLARGQRVLMGLSGHEPAERTATVQWVERRGSRTVAGLRFDPISTEDLVLQ